MSEPNTDLRDAQSDLGEVVEEAREHEYSPPSVETIELADRLLREMYKLRPCRFEVYPTDDSEIDILAVGGDPPTRSTVSVSCHAEEGVRCFVITDGRQSRYASYRPVVVGDLPDGFIREALNDLGEE